MPLRFLSYLLFAMAALAGALSNATAADFSPEQRTQIEAIVRDYLKTHPDVLIDAMQAAEDKLKADTKDKAAKALADHHREVFDDPQSPVAGNPKGM